MVIETFEKNGVTVEIMYDESCESPRENDNLGTMLGWHRAYQAGDKHNFRDVAHWLRSMVNYEDALDAPESLVLDHLPYWVKEPPTEDDLEWARQHMVDSLQNDDDDAKQWAFDVLHKTHLILPVYLYDHSGVMYKTAPFSCPWDSGQVGFIYVSHADIQKEYGAVNDETLGKAAQVLTAEVKEYSMWANGECYGYVCKDEGGGELNSCWGFIGYEYVEEEAKRVLDYYAARAATAKEAVKEYGYA